ncbi:MAG: hypothetical protein ACRD2E_08410 [Terriglobales bacterium]
MSRLTNRPGWAAGLGLFFLAAAAWDLRGTSGGAAATRGWIPALVLLAVAAQAATFAFPGRFARRDRVLFALIALLGATWAVALVPGFLAPGGEVIAAAASAALEISAAGVCVSALIARRDLP